MKYGFIYTTINNPIKGQKLARDLLAKRLIACANIFPATKAIYEWQGNVQEDSSSVMILKTREDLFENVSKTLKALHPDTCPCIVFIPLSKGYKPFFNWIDQQLNLPPIKKVLTTKG